jgi:glycosyltransferase involved in cell wall biosynthesis
VLADQTILVLTTREKDFWLSMQEVIPAIEQVWTAIGQSQRVKVRMFQVPLPSDLERYLLTSAPQLKRIVVTVTTPATVRMALLLRTKVAAPMTVYVYGDAVEGLHAFGELADALTQSDMFVVSCEAEAVAVRCCFPDAQVSVIPLPLVDQFKLNSADQGARQGAPRLAYVGRVSEQKNLHMLLFSLWILHTWLGCAPGITLDVYGGEDNLGSPNIGLTFPNYGSYLENLAALLDVRHLVRWHGLKPRDWLFDHVHTKPHIFVSPTLHSDENFGSSLLASLVNGQQAVTTAWGGHFGFQEWFPEQLTLTPVHRSTMGPVVDPGLLAGAILWAVKRAVVVPDAALDRARAQFSISAVTRRTMDMLGRPDERHPVPLKKSTTQQNIDERRVLFGGTRKIFADYQDPDVHRFFEAYGMKEPIAFHPSSSYVLAPWTRYSKHVLSVVDPHRGNQRFAVDAGVANSMDVTMCPSRETLRLPVTLVETLVTQGYAFALPPVPAVGAGPA